ncbi:hypothetical protein J4573_39155 [Actinomadura barringtoniae]|uniref:Uncharacterized protein n=1 Tax=Actinomadura barringtoniae TaxID=1427535 RepID=A0A939PR08_9ACTN|nr:hypothetical protein [Actinomadura barringtoniae]MBO2453166.1 hypothetical protein [Actinomadura barringtoniae]
MTDRTYAELISAIDEFARDWDSREQASRLYGLFAPLLDHVEQQDAELSDEQTMSTPEAVREVRRAAAGEPVDAQAIYEQLALVSLVEDQDEDLHLIGQSAMVAADWLRLLTGLDLTSTTYPGEGELLPRYAPSPFTQIVDMLAWTRSNQMYNHWEDADDNADYADFSAATHELNAIYLEITA